VAHRFAWDSGSFPFGTVEVLIICFERWFASYQYLLVVYVGIPNWLGLLFAAAIDGAAGALEEGRNPWKHDEFV
jgi:hypothetical protein